MEATWPRPFTTAPLLIDSLNKRSEVLLIPILFSKSGKWEADREGFGFHKTQERIFLLGAPKNISNTQHADRVRLCRRSAASADVLCRCEAGGIGSCAPGPLRSSLAVRRLLTFVCGRVCGMLCPSVGVGQLMRASDAQSFKQRGNLCLP